MSYTPKYWKQNSDETFLIPLEMVFEKSSVFIHATTEEMPFSIISLNIVVNCKIRTAESFEDVWYACRVHMKCHKCENCYNSTNLLAIR